MSQDILQTAKERYSEACEAFRENRVRMLEDLAFSNPADPQQWESSVRRNREQAKGGERPCLTFDQTNQYIAQVVNDSRQNKPSIKVIPVHSGADIQVAEKLEGLIRHIEYTSRATLAYDTAQEYAARIGIGWIRVASEVINKAHNEQEIRIKVVRDPLSVVIDPYANEPDGSDASYGFVETSLSPAAFKRLYPKAATQSWESENNTSDWFNQETIRVCEYFYKENEQVKWVKMTGAEILEQTDFPSRYIPLIPVLGYDLFIEGKRYLCGMTRRMRDAQKAYNYERTAYIETVALQPKAPYLVDWESIDTFQDEWDEMNTSNSPYLRYHSITKEGRPLAPPRREGAPAVGAAFIQGGNLALNDIQASIGMYRANLGAPSNETSGIAIRNRQREGDTANYHYIDNQSRAIEHLGRIIVDMIPKIYDTQRIAQITHEDGKSESVTIHPELPQAKMKTGQGMMINPNVGTYDVRVKSGPSYTTLRQEASDAMGQLLQGNPNAFSVLGGEWAKLQDWPNSEKISRLLLAMAPPQVQAVEQGDTDVPPAIQAQMIQLKQQNEQLQQQLQQASQQLATNEREVEQKAQSAEVKHTIEAYRAETDRLKVVGPALQPEEIKALVMQTLKEVLNAPSLGGNAAQSNPQLPENMSAPPDQAAMGMEGDQANGPPDQMLSGAPPPGDDLPDEQSQQPPEPPSGGFFTSQGEQ